MLKSLRRCWLAGLLCAGSLHAFPFSFKDGEISGSLDTTASWGLGMRTEKRDPRFVSVFGGGTGTVAAANTDDGNLNYDQWDLYENFVKAVMELDLRYGSWSAFARADGRYDFQVMHVKPRRGPHNTATKGILGHDARLLDYYIQKDSELFDMGLTVRFGEQVINWGESTFITNGMNIINPVDVSKLRSAGAQLREALLPLPMLRVDLIVNDEFSAMAFWNWWWRGVRLDPKGSYFSTLDVLGPNSEFQMIDPTGTADDTAPIFGGPFATAIPRQRGSDGCDLANAGLVLRYFSEALHDTEFQGFFAIYASRAETTSWTQLVTGAPLPTPPAVPINYITEYQNDLYLLGLSFNTLIGDWALQGEYSFHMRQPLQVDISYLLGRVVAGLEIGDLTPGMTGLVKGFRRKNYSQLQATTTRLFGPTWGADEALLLIEGGMTFIHDLEKKSRLPYLANGSYGDCFSAGYRILANLVFQNVIGPMSLTPQAAFEHDVFGSTPAPLVTFSKDRMQATLSLSARYFNFEGAVAWTPFFNGGLRNVLLDRDFLTVSASYAY